MKRYKIIMEFLYGWDDMEFDDDEKVVTYSTKKEAEQSLIEYMDDVNEAHEQGYTNSPFEDNCLVVEV